ncbi:MAG: amidohydrolase [Phycisphaeraceae bacterium]|nr:amidohydrolase [Phycisphaeraceae bacterium]
MTMAAAKPSSVSEPKPTGNQAVAGLIGAELPSLIAIRHDLHAHPELNYQEKRTSELVQRELALLAPSGLTLKAGLAKGTGVLAYLPPTDKSREGKPSVGLRADMDALPITESTGKKYSSTVPGVMHACGHDGHVTLLLGAARVLSKLANRPRGVHFLFQPAEESGAGADAMCRDGVLDGKVIGPKIERMYGLHGWPTLALNVVGSRPGAMLAATDDVIVTITGEQSHAAYPHYAKDPILCVAQCLISLQQLVARNSSPFDNIVCSMTMIKGGTANNIIPREAQFQGTIRTLTPEARALAKKRFFEIVNGVAAAHDCKAQIDWHEGYPVTFNDPALTEKWFATATRTLGEKRVHRIPEPTMGGEDFSYYAQKVPSVFFTLGLQRPDDKNPATLHQPEFDFNDDALATGVEMFVALATE